jgi:hypothetical protein
MDLLGDPLGLDAFDLGVGLVGGAGAGDVVQGLGMERRLAPTVTPGGREGADGEEELRAALGGAMAAEPEVTFIFLFFDRFPRNHVRLGVKATLKRIQR